MIVTFALLFVVAPVLSSGLGEPAHAADRDCSSFSTQRAAQEFFLANDPRDDPHLLDADGDGIACESNPCPCSTQRAPVGFVGGTTGPERLVQWGRITRVVDGDTVDVRLASGRHRSVRLIGIDSPETRFGAECGGSGATVALTRKLPVGTRVKLLSDPTQAAVDRYDRLLRYVVRAADGRDMNRSQVYDGRATVYVYGGVPFQRVDGYRVAQRAAVAADRGLWGAC